jgi:hypothetical protein
VFIFFLNTYFLLTIFLSLCNLNNSHVSFLWNDSISLTMASFQSFPSAELITSSTDLGSSSMEINTYVEQKSSKLYLSTSFLTRFDLRTTGVGCSTSSYDSVDSSKIIFFICQFKPHLLWIILCLSNFFKLKLTSDFSKHHISTVHCFP